MQQIFIIALSAIMTFALPGQTPYAYKLAVLKYSGGGDWYANPSALSNLSKFANQQLSARIDPEYATVEAGASELFNYPFVHMTGHGNVVFNEQEVRNLRAYLEAGGFLHIDDNYGMDQFIRKELNKIFPDQKAEALPPDHPVFRQKFTLRKGLPKIHQHDAEPPQALVYRLEGRMVLLYTTESDLGDGWEDQAVHNDPEEKRKLALQMGLNILQFVLTGQNEPN